MTYHIQKYRVVLFGAWWYWFSIGQYWLVLGGTGSVSTLQAVAGWYLVVLGQYWAVLVGTWW